MKPIRPLPIAATLAFLALNVAWILTPPIPRGGDGGTVDPPEEPQPPPPPPDPYPYPDPEPNENPWGW